MQGLINNFDELESLIIEKQFDFRFATETHTTSLDENKVIELKNYNIVRCNSASSYTGGIIFYVKDN